MFMSEKLPGMYQERYSDKEQVGAYIESFEAPARNLLTQLDEDIRANRYAYVLGIDAAGRIPARIVGKYISELNRQRGLPEPKCLFTTPHQEKYATPQLSEMLDDIGAFEVQGKRVLVIDDTLFKGNSLRLATAELRNFHIPFDIGVFLAINNDAEGIERYRDVLEAHALYVGDYAVYADESDENGALPIIKRDDLAGVRRASKAATGKPSARISSVHIPDKDLFLVGRKEIDSMVKRLILERSQHAE